MASHVWGPTRVGHGIKQCVHCKMTYTEATVLGDECPSAPPEDATALSQAEGDESIDQRKARKDALDILHRYRTGSIRMAEDALAELEALPTRPREQEGIDVRAEMAREAKFLVTSALGISSELKSCPFCGGAAERHDITGGEWEGGSCIECKQCGASSPIHFDRKENLLSSWNGRARPREQEGAEPVAQSLTLKAIFVGEPTIAALRALKNVKLDSHGVVLMPAGDLFEAARTGAHPLPAASFQAPKGWKLVPLQPDETMMNAGLYQASHDAEFADVYSSYVDMLAAAPEPPEVAASFQAGVEAMREADETGWLIELKGNEPAWWSLPPNDEACWTKSAIDALRFARKQDADAYINETGWTEAFATEHAWVAKRPLPIPASSEGR